MRKSNGAEEQGRQDTSEKARRGQGGRAVGLAPDRRQDQAGDLYGQTRRCLEIIEQAIAAAGLGLQHVIRTRVMLTDMSRWQEAARAHGEVFSGVRPACTFVEVKGLIDPGWLVEIEADCVAEIEF